MAILPRIQYNLHKKNPMIFFIKVRKNFKILMKASATVSRRKTTQMDQTLKVPTSNYRGEPQ